jgi:hypothetical protein
MPTSCASEVLADAAERRAKTGGSDAQLLRDLLMEEPDSEVVDPAANWHSRRGRW